MVALLQAGQAKDLSDAYEQAIYANPITRASVLQQQTQQVKAESAERAQRAKAASSVNMRSRPPIDTAEPVGSIDDTIRRTYRQLTGSN